MTAARRNILHVYADVIFAPLPIRLYAFTINELRQSTSAELFGLSKSHTRTELYCLERYA